MVTAVDPMLTSSSAESLKSLSSTDSTSLGKVRNAGIAAHDDSSGSTIPIDSASLTPQTPPSGPINVSSVPSDPQEHLPPSDTTPHPPPPPPPPPQLQPPVKGMTAGPVPPLPPQHNTYYGPPQPPHIQGQGPPPRFSLPYPPVPGAGPYPPYCVPVVLPPGPPGLRGPAGQPLPPPSHFYARPPPPSANNTLWRRSFHPSIAADSDNYLPESSVLVASAASRPRKPSPYPPPTMENLSNFRAEAQKSNDPGQLLDLAKYMIETIPHLQVQDTDRAAKVREALSTEAYKIVKRLAKSFPEAMYYLAHCYSIGSGVISAEEKDMGKAFSLYLLGAKQNHPACSYRVAVCYELGAGTKKDKAHAIMYYRKAANLGDASAMYKLGLILLKGLIGQSKTPREGISWLKRATQANGSEDIPQAFHDLGLAYEKEGVPSVIPDLDYSRDLFTHAAQYGFAPAQFKLGLAYENGFLNCPIDARRSIAWYSKAAEQGHLEAELALSGWYLTGAEGILQQSDQEAYLWARRAADRGYPKAEYAVGYYTETGVGIRQNLEEAKRWYMRAASQQNQRAIRRLQELKRTGPQKKRKHTRGQDGAPDGKDGECILM